MVNLNDDFSLHAEQRVRAKCLSLSTHDQNEGRERERGEEGGGGRNSNVISDRSSSICSLAISFDSASSSPWLPDSTPLSPRLPASMFV